VINLYINERRIGDVIVLDLKGRVRITGATALHRSIRCLVEEGKTQILLNLSQVTHIDSGGLGELVASRVTVNNKGGELKLSHPTERMREVMTMTNLLPLFEIYNNEHDAVASFKGEVLRIVEPLQFLSNGDLQAQR
jgi:anti-sigma B factor antagonist